MITSPRSGGGSEAEGINFSGGKRRKGSDNVQGERKREFIDITERLSIFSNLRKERPFMPATPSDLAECLESIIDTLISLCEKLRTDAEKTEAPTSSALLCGCAARLDASLRKAWNVRSLLGSGDSLLKALSFLTCEAIANQLTRSIEEVCQVLRQHKLSFEEKCLKYLDQLSSDLDCFAKKAFSSVENPLREMVVNTFGKE